MKAISFDATGTLFFCPDLSGIYVRILGRHGLDIQASQVERLFPVVLQEMDCRLGPGEDRFSSHPDGARGFWRELIERLCALAETGTPSRFAIAELYDFFMRREAWSLYTEVLEVLDRLAVQNYRLLVLSNWDERLPRVLTALGIGDHFEQVATSQDLGLAKPHPHFFRRAIEPLGVEPAQVLHVGDHPIEDFEGAQAAGLQSHLLTRDGAGPLMTLDGLFDLLDGGCRKR